MSRSVATAQRTAVCVQKAEERMDRDNQASRRSGPSRAKGRPEPWGLAAPGTSRLRWEDLGLSGRRGTLWGLRGFQLFPESGELGEGVQLGTGEVASGVRGEPPDCWGCRWGPRKAGRAG